jgi:hypothetical protein
MWQELVQPDLGAPQPLIVRVESIAPRHSFADHTHPWNQLVYAISGVLTVTIEGSCFVIPSEQAAWVPIGTRHRVGSLLGAEFRSLWLDDEICSGIATKCVVFSVSPLLRALIIEAAALQDDRGDAGYASRVTHLIVDQLRRARPFPQHCLGRARVRSRCCARHFTPSPPIGVDPSNGRQALVCRLGRLPGASEMRSGCL